MKVPTGGCQCVTSWPICLVVNHRALQIFVAMAILCPGALRDAASSTEATHALSLVDVNGNNLSMADGHVTIMVLATTEDLDKARAVGIASRIIASATLITERLQSFDSPKNVVQFCGKSRRQW